MTSFTSNRHFCRYRFIAIAASRDFYSFVVSVVRRGREFRVRVRGQRGITTRRSLIYRPGTPPAGVALAVPISHPLRTRVEHPSRAARLALLFRRVLEIKDNDPIVPRVYCGRQNGMDISSIAGVHYSRLDVCSGLLALAEMRTLNARGYKRNTLLGLISLGLFEY